MAHFDNFVIITVHPLPGIMKKKLKTQCKIFRYENMFKLIIFKLIVPKIQAPKYYYNCGFWKSDPQWRSISDGYKPGPVRARPGSIQFLGLGLKILRRA